MKIIALILLAFVSLTAVAQQNCRPQLLKAVQVIYPDSARVAGVEGVVYVEIRIGKDGLVKKATVTKSDNKLLNKAAVNAVVRYVFESMDYECSATIPVRFELKQ